MKCFPIKTVSFIIIILILFITRASLFNTIITYKSIGQRKSYSIQSKNIINELDSIAKNTDNIAIEAVIIQSLTYTSKKLHFTFSKTSHNPNKIYITKEANCVRYASFFTSVCSYLLKKSRLDNTWIATSHRGQLYLFDYNIHNYFHAPFFKDHDFVVIENRDSGEKFAVDPTVHDYVHIDFITIE